MNKIFQIILFILIVIGTSCKHNDNVQSIDLTSCIGEYQMLTTTCLKQGSDMFPVAKTISSVARIYKQGNDYFIQTDYFGYPDTLNSIFSKPVNIIGRRKVALKTDSLIEVVTKPTSRPIYLMNYLILIPQDGVIYFPSCPMKLHTGAENILKCEPCPFFILSLLNNNGYVLKKAETQFKYGNIIRKDSTLFWDVELPLDTTIEGLTGTRIVTGNTIYYQNSLYKK